MKRTLRFAWLALALGLLPCLGAAEAPAKTGQKITKDFTETPVVDVIAELSKYWDFSVALQGNIPKDLRVNLSLRNAGPEEALSLVCLAADLKCERTEGGILISVPPTATVSGTRIPIVGAAPTITISGRNIVLRKDEQGRIVDVEVDGRSIALPGSGPGVGYLYPRASVQEWHPPFKGDTSLVDLEVKDGLLAEAVAQLSKVSGIEIVVDEAVPKEIKVTAKIRKMALGEVLSLLASQAGLAYTVGEDEKKYVAEDIERIVLAEEKLQWATERLKEGVGSRLEVLEGQAELLNARRTARHLPKVYIAPKPELKVSGPGVITPAEEIVRRVQESVRPAASTTARQLMEQVFGHCPKCHTNLLSREWKFCPHCGAKQPAPEKVEAKPK